MKWQRKYEEAAEEWQLKKRRPSGESEYEGKTREMKEKRKLTAGEEKTARRPGKACGGYPWRDRLSCNSAWLSGWLREITLCLNLRYPHPAFLFMAAMANLDKYHSVIRKCVACNENGGLAAESNVA